MNFSLLTALYKLTHPGVTEDRIPYWYKRSFVGEVGHLIRKAICQNIAPNCVFTPVRLWLYRLCGFKIGKNVFIGMKCYLDDLCVDKCVIEDNVTISYGVYMTQHGYAQSHNRLIFRGGAYVGMRSMIVARDAETEIGENAVVGAGSLVLHSVPPNTVYAGNPARFIKENKKN